MHSDADLTFDDLIRLTTDDPASTASNVTLIESRRSRGQRVADAAPAAPVVPAAVPSPVSAVPVAAAAHVNRVPDSTTLDAKVSKKGRFHRPELYSRWETLTGNLAFKVAGWSLLVLATAAVVALAVARFAG